MPLLYTYICLSTYIIHIHNTYYIYMYELQKERASVSSCSRWPCGPGLSLAKAGARSVPSLPAGGRAQAQTAAAAFPCNSQGVASEVEHLDLNQFPCRVLLSE